MICLKLYQWDFVHQEKLFFTLNPAGRFSVDKIRPEPRPFELLGMGGVLRPNLGLEFFRDWLFLRDEVLDKFDNPDNGLGADGMLPAEIK